MIWKFKGKFCKCISARYLTLSISPPSDSFCQILAMVLSPRVSFRLAQRCVLALIYVICPRLPQIYDEKSLFISDVGHMFVHISYFIFMRHCFRHVMVVLKPILFQ